MPSITRSVVSASKRRPSTLIFSASCRAVRCRSIRSIRWATCVSFTSSPRRISRAFSRFPWAS